MLQDLSVSWSFSLAVLVVAGDFWLLLVVVDLQHFLLTSTPHPHPTASCNPCLPACLPAGYSPGDGDRDCGGKGGVAILQPLARSLAYIQQYSRVQFCTVQYSWDWDRLGMTSRVSGRRINQ